MPIIKKEYTLYGLEGYTNIIDNIIDLLDTDSKNNELRVILTEALSNAFIHGNKEDPSKPICIRVFTNKSSVRFEIEDCGTGFGNIKASQEGADSIILDEDFRGLKLINCFADSLEFKGNTMIITKYID